jgi:integrase
VLTDIARGLDPSGSKRASRAAAAARKNALTVGMAMDRWQAAKADRWTARTAESVASSVRLGIPPALRNRPLTETGRADWVAAVELARPRGTGAVSTLYRAISAFLSFAEASGLIEAHPLPRRGAAQLAPLPRPRTRVLDDAELVRVWHAAAEFGRHTACFTRLLILTGARRSEVAGITAGEVNLQASVWNIPASRAKNHTARRVALGRLALAELRAVWPSGGAVADSCRLLAQRDGNALSNFCNRKRRLDVAADVSGWCWHDLRRTMRTGLARLRVHDDVAEFCVGHLSGRPALARVYDHFDRTEEAMAALLRWQNFVTQLIGHSVDDTGVVRLTPAA